MSRMAEGRVFTVARTPGSNLVGVITDTIFKNPEQAISELFANSHDADAENCGLELSKNDRRLVLTDDGKGMDDRGVEAFFRVGDSIKLEERVSGRGRVKLGKFGIASSAVMYLARRHMLETWQGGRKRTVIEEFHPAQTYDTSRDIQVVETVDDEFENGTRITLDEVYPEILADVNIIRLMTRLGDEMPVLRDFSMSVNGLPVTPYEVKDGAVEYVIDVRRDRTLGKVTGSFWYSKKGFGKRNGIYVKVHQRTIVGEDLNLGRKLSLGMRNRVRAIVHADALEPDIGLARSDFKHSERLRKLRDIVDVVTRQIAADSKLDETSVKMEVASRDFPKTLDRVSLDLKESVGHKPKIVFTSERGAIGNWDPKTGEIYVNPKGPLARLPNYSPKGVERTLRSAILGSLSLGYIPDIGNVARMEQLLLDNATRGAKGFKGRGRYLDDLLEKEGKRRQFTRISDNRLYSLREFGRITAMSNSILKRMKAAGIIEEYKDDAYLGSEVRKIEEEFHSVYTLFEVCKDIDIPEAQEDIDFALRQSRERSATNRLNKLASRDELPDWIVNKGREGMEPLYVVQEEHYDSLLHYLNTWELEKE
jgi:hypothetical protein